jgi:hypothetical protein
MIQEFISFLETAAVCRYFVQRGRYVCPSQFANCL